MGNIPTNLRYTRSHEWARQEADNVVTVGISHHAQELLGDLVFIQLPDIGHSITAGDTCAVVESVKAASDVYAPLTGEIVAVNKAVSDAPESVNNNAYDAWLFKIKAKNSTDFEALLDADAYSNNIEDQETPPP